MERPQFPQPFTFPSGPHPTSPPMTPGHHSHIRITPQASHTSASYKRMGFAMLDHSPPLEHIQPIGQGPHFSYSRPQSTTVSSRASTASGPGNSTNEQSSEDDESGPEEENGSNQAQPSRRVEHADFVLEELDSDPDYDSDIEVVRPDHYEDAKSEKSGGRLEDSGLLHRFQDLRCEHSSSDEEEQQRLYRRKKKRWSAGIYNKRTHSQSIEGDSSYSDNDPLDDVDSSARRLRRRVRGPGDRSSLLFEDKGVSNTNNIAEVEEPEDGHVIPHIQGPPSIPSDDAFTLDELPFYVTGEPMYDLEYESV
ncbi:uncharacterized protein EI97DRAFT_234347 [Westerdykella ornata]|uniref:Uncharacterized protein n=1 Tax=Westerdykella ornata TaxID=318751 RepID=A0A6A6J7B0_WESOR|nr:uncharacterized protein EI97DRAFT_234347 [Westerdykella ornata]KAF2272124.1 hypothetical protein EI97DRAFT_234347 [Westerdykella ornata]